MEFDKIEVRFNIDGSPPPYKDKGTFENPRDKNYFWYTLRENEYVFIEIEDGSVYRRSWKDLETDFKKLPPSPSTT